MDGSTKSIGQDEKQIEPTEINDPESSEHQIFGERISIPTNPLSALTLHEELFEGKRSKLQKKKFSIKKKTEGLRTKLPKIEAYQQIIRFPAEGPGRVIFRLERLMGNANIRPVDPKYMSKLRWKLEDEERNKWKTRILQRRKAEENRLRKLVIDGYADPLPGMEDLEKHPVFRVNRIIGRLADIDKDIRGTVDVRLPPIQLKEPFEEYKESGLLFGSHSTHYLKTKLKPTIQLEESSNKLVLSNLPQFDANGKLVSASSGKVVSAKLVQSAASSVSSHPINQDEISRLKAEFGITDTNLEAIWKEHESPLLEMLNAQKGINRFFETSDKILATFAREERASENFLNKTYRQLFSKA